MGTDDLLPTAAKLFLLAFSPRAADISTEIQKQKVLNWKAFAEKNRPGWKQNLVSIRAGLILAVSYPVRADTHGEQYRIGIKDYGKHFIAFMR